MSATEASVGATRWMGNVAILLMILTFGYLGQSLIKFGLGHVGGFSFQSFHAIARFFAGCLSNGYVCLGVFCTGLGFAMWIAFLSRLDLSQALLMIAIGYLPWLLIGRFVFHEQIGPLRILGAVLIMIGVICVGLSKPK